MGDERTPAPGWYPDPERAGGQRYWDGQQWTEDRTGIDANGLATAQGTGADPGDETADGESTVVGQADRRWYERRRVLLPAAAFVGLLFGVSVAGTETDADSDALQDAEMATAAAEDELSAETQRADDAEEALAALEDDHAAETAELEERMAELDGDRDVDEARADLEDERDEIIAAAQEEAEEILAEAEGRMAALDEREAQLDDRAAALDVAEEEAEASTFGNGVHVVGDDVEAGTWRNDGGSNCYWARLSGLSGDFDELLANDLPDGPTTVEIRSSDVAFESSGCAEWQRVD